MPNQRDEFVRTFFTKAFGIDVLEAYVKTPIYPKGNTLDLGCNEIELVLKDRVIKLTNSEWGTLSWTHK